MQITLKNSFIHVLCLICQRCTHPDCFRFKILCDDCRKGHENKHKNNQFFQNQQWIITTQECENQVSSILKKLKEELEFSESKAATALMAQVNTNIDEAIFEIEQIRQQIHKLFDKYIQLLRDTFEQKIKEGILQTYQQITSQLEIVREFMTKTNYTDIQRKVIQTDLGYQVQYQKNRLENLIYQRINQKFNGIIDADVAFRCVGVIQKELEDLVIYESPNQNDDYDEGMLFKYYSNSAGTKQIKKFRSAASIQTPDRQNDLRTLHTNSTSADYAFYRSWLFHFEPGTKNLHYIDLKSKTPEFKKIELDIDFTITNGSRSIMGCDGKIYYISGYDDGLREEQNKIIYQYDHLGVTLIKKTKMQTLRKNFSLVATNDYEIYIIGGQNYKEGCLSKCEKYNINTNYTILINHLNELSTLHVTCLYNNKLIFKYGGLRVFIENENFLNPCQEQLEVYFIEQDQWSHVKISQNPQNQPIHTILSSGIQLPNSNKIYIFGGQMINSKIRQPINQGFMIQIEEVEEMDQAYNISKYFQQQQNFNLNFLINQYLLLIIQVIIYHSLLYLNRKYKFQCKRKECRDIVLKKINGKQFELIMYILKPRIVNYSNNINENLILYASRNILDNFNIITYGYVFIENQLAILMNDNDDELMNENEISISEHLFLQIKDIKNPDIKKAPYSSIPYNQQNPRYNFFPNLPFCKELLISVINNENAKFAYPKLLKALLEFPILIREKSIIKLTLKDVNLQSKLQIQNCETNLKMIQKISNFSQIKNHIKDCYLYIYIDKIHSEKQSDYYILDMKNVEIKLQEDFYYTYLPKEHLHLNFLDSIYWQGEYKDFKLQLQSYIQLKRTIFIGLESKKSVGKSQLFKQLALQNGLMYKEKDLEMIGSLRFTEKLVSKIQDTPCLLYLKNFAKLESVILLSKQHVTKEELCQEIIKIMKRIKKLKYVILILGNIDFSNFSILKSSVDFFIRFYPTTNVSNLLKEFYELEQDEDDLSQLLKESSWRTIEKEIIKNKDQYFQILQKKLKTQTISSNTKMEDIGGMEGAIKEVAKTITLPQMYPELFDELVKPRRGILFFGPPGTGKTLLAKCIAYEMKMNFISVKGPEMLNQYIGQSESNIRDLFKKAKDNAPSLIFFDELDALAPARGNQSDSNQVMDRIVAQLLTEIDNLSQNIFIIGATNRPDLLDLALLRPGRFDKLLYLGIKTDRESRIKILRALCKSDKFDNIVDEIPTNMTGADFYGLVSQATIYATKRTIQLQLQEMELEVDDIREALKNIRPSVSEDDLKKYEELRKKYQ